jgi:hypothetical protein
MLILIALASGSYQGEVEVEKTVAVLGLITIWVISVAAERRAHGRCALSLDGRVTARLGHWLRTEPVPLAAGLVVLRDRVRAVAALLGLDQRPSWRF